MNNGRAPTGEDIKGRGAASGWLFVLSIFMRTHVMRKCFYLGGILFLGLLTESLSQRSFRRVYRVPGPSDDSDPVEQRLFALPYGEAPRFLFRNPEEDRRDVEESRPLCEEERKSFNVRELIYTSAFNFLQTGNGLSLRKYNLIPRKVDVIRCASRGGADSSDAVCKPENCRERKVDIEVFGRLKNETANVWEFVGTLPAVPVACECFFRWKPEKCSRSVDAFADF